MNAPALKRTMKRAVKQGLASSLGWRWVGPYLRQPGVIVLMYHRILGADRGLHGLPVESFAAQMRWVREHCEPIWPEELKDRASGRRAARAPVLVTFDDGLRDYYDLAYPILKDLRIPALMFLPTSFLDQGGGMLWTDQVQWAALSTPHDRVRLPWTGPNDAPIPLPDSAARAALSDAARTHLKTLPDGERRAAVDALLRELGAPSVQDRQMLTWDEARAMTEFTRYGGHSHTHPIMSRLDHAALISEVQTCRERIAAELGSPPTTFAYPNGRPADYNDETKAVLRENGFTMAFSTSEGIARPDSDWMAIKRLPGYGDNIPDFVWVAAGLSRSG